MLTDANSCRVNTSNQNSDLSGRDELELVLVYRDGEAAAALPPPHDPGVTARVLTGKSAEERLLTSHIPLVKSMARSLHARVGRYAEMDELLGAGYEALVLALRQFDTTRGCRFSTYARQKIKFNMSAAVRRLRWPMKIPDHLYKELIVLARHIRGLVSQLGEEPSISQIVEHTGMPDYKIRQLLAWSIPQDLSLDSPVGGDGDAVLADFVPNEQNLWSRSPCAAQEEVADGELREQIITVLHSLTPREEKVIRLAFGLDAESPVPRSSAEIAALLEVHPERIRNLLRKGLRKTRHPSRSRRLRTFDSGWSP